MTNPVQLPRVSDQLRKKLRKKDRKAHRRKLGDAMDGDSRANRKKKKKG